MASPSNVVKTTNPSNDDFFLCRAFAKAVSSDKLIQIIEQQPVAIEPVVETTPSTDNPSILAEINQWKVGDLCLCPYSEDGLLYRATIIHIDPSSCTVSFDDYGNEETHPLTDLQLRTEEEEEEEEEEEIEEQQQQQQQELLPSIDESDILPPPPPPPLPPFPVLNPTDDNDTLSSTLMSWYLAGYHTGFYQGINNKKF
jgi:survival motor neuron protein